MLTNTQKAKMLQEYAADHCFASIRHDDDGSITIFVDYTLNFGRGFGYMAVPCHNFAELRSELGY